MTREESIYQAFCAGTSEVEEQGYSASNPYALGTEEYLAYERGREQQLEIEGFYNG